MHFAYPSLVATSFEGMRLYETPNGQFYPSITTVLGNTMSREKAEALEKWYKSLGDEAAKKSKEAADNGTAVHLLIERHLKGEKLVQPGESFSDKQMAQFNSLKLSLKKIDKVIAQEVALYSDELRVAGRCDCVAVYKGEASIIDFKTSRRLKQSDDIEDYKLQLCAYAMMHNELFQTNIMQGVIIMSSDGGFPQEFVVELFDYVDPLIERINKFYLNLSV